MPLTPTDEAAQRLQKILQELYVFLHEWLGEEAVTPAPVAEVGPKRSNRKKLSQKDAEHIRELKRAGYTQADIAAVYDVHPSTIGRIVAGVYYR
ncbi:HTH DNA binding protein [Mycobacterium phage DroogsArmy]|uniref:Transposase IS30-like HTH domain-containing protein n=2 Tax=Timshelvirus TaxID=2948926 RepID=G1DB63_9CAUD|nr:HTH DNA binding protein [Mycobacterium phage Timshel]YP_010061997.1 HTH DNA binding protein [Mycobacterium phage DroogsArmy]AEJ92388.1 hypothetical protein TIMSHEL_45 [Mycobacterium phage Timshel]QKO02439.1 helix-turn-helix DNA binding domain protein [Mycobacterium phage DroogsArmy]